MGGCSLTWTAPQLSEWWIQHSTLQSTQSCVGSSVGFFHHGFFIPSKATFGSSELSLQSLLWVSTHTIYRSPWVMEGRWQQTVQGDGVSAAEGKMECMEPTMGRMEVCASQPPGHGDFSWWFPHSVLGMPTWSLFPLIGVICMKCTT